jgi:hypothetical protein
MLAAREIVHVHYCLFLRGKNEFLVADHRIECVRSAFLAEFTELLVACYQASNFCCLLFVCVYVSMYVPPQFCSL